MFLGKQFKYLNENEIAGAETINPMVSFLRGIRSDGVYIILNPNANGSMSIDLDLESLRDALDLTVTGDELQHTFKATATGSSSFTVSGGTVYFGEQSRSVSGSGTLTGTTGVYIELTSSAVTWKRGTVSNIFDPSSQKVNLPICLPYTDDGELKFRYYHVGNFFFNELPIFWISGYNKANEQILTHSANSDSLLWQDVAPCDE